MTVTVYSRTINGKKGEWQFHSLYTDGMENGKKREKDYAKLFNKKDRDKEYKVEVENNE
tara:strand:+ start:305 stop:481 length:177 start_codon:yes stop_codon:yes gene_type:complete